MHDEKEEWEQFDEEDEIEEVSWKVKLLRVVLASVLLFSLIYFSGIRQYLFFARTSSEIEIDYLEPVLDYELVEIPVQVILIREDLIGSQRTKEEVVSLLENSSKILNQANIRLKKDLIIEKEKNQEEVVQIIEGNFQSLEVLDQEKINLVLVRVLRGINGVAYPGINTTVIPDYTAGLDFRVLAHEVGHILGLYHQENSRYLMSQGATGNLLTKEEVIIMRQKFDEKFSK